MAGTISQSAQSALRPFETDGVPASGAHEPLKSDLVAVLAQIDGALQALGLAGSVTILKSTLSALNGDLAHADQSVAIVYGDSTAANNGFYVKSGASGTGSWAIKFQITSSFATEIAGHESRISANEGSLSDLIQRRAVFATADVSGTANALVLNPAVALTAYKPDQEIVFIPLANNTGAMTVNVSGLGVVPLKNYGGSDFANGDIISGRPYRAHLVTADSGFRLTSQVMGYYDTQTLARAQILRLTGLTSTLVGGVRKYVVTAPNYYDAPDSSGRAYWLVVDVTFTETSATLQVNGATGSAFATGTALPIRTPDDTPIKPGDLVAGTRYLLKATAGVCYHVMSPVGAVPYRKADVDEQIAAKADGVVISGIAAYTPDRPGEGLATTALAGDTDAALAAAVDPTWRKNDAQLGACIEVAGAHVPSDPGSLTIASVDVTPLYPGHIYRGTWKTKRTVDASDPEDDSVERGAAWLAFDKTQLSGGSATTVASDDAVDASDGDNGVVTVVKFFAFEAHADDPDYFVIPADAKYARRYQTVFGTVATTRIGLSALEDVTDQISGGADVAVLSERVTSTEDSVDSLASAKADKATALSSMGLMTGSGTLGGPITFNVIAASSGEAITGTAANRAMTPVANKAALDNRVSPIEAMIAPARSTAKRAHTFLSDDGKILGSLTTAGEWFAGAFRGLKRTGPQPGGRRAANRFLSDDGKLLGQISPKGETETFGVRFLRRGLATPGRWKGGVNSADGKRVITWDGKGHVRLTLTPDALAAAGGAGDIAAAALPAMGEGAAIAGRSGSSGFNTVFGDGYLRQAQYYKQRASDLRCIALTSQRALIIPGEGQSNIVGGGAASGDALTSVSPLPFHVLALNDAKKTRGLNASATFAPSGSTDLVPATEFFNGGDMGETPMTQFGCMLAEHLVRLGRTPPPISVRSHGYSGHDIAAIGAGSLSSQNGMAETRRSFELFRDVWGVAAWSPFCLNIFGEQDRAEGTAKATFKTQHGAMQDERVTAAKDATNGTGQAETQGTIFLQLTGEVFGGTSVDASIIADAQLELCIERADSIMAGPAYPYPMNHDQTIHRSPVGNDLVGERMAIAAAETLAYGRNRQGVWPATWSLSGDTITIKVANVREGLVIDTESLTAHPTLGFKFEDSTTSAAVQSVTIVDRDTIAVKLTAAPTGTGKTLYYAWRGITGNAALYSASWGNLRDGGPGIPSRCIPSYTHFDWLCARSMAIT